MATTEQERHEDREQCDCPICQALGQYVDRDGVIRSQETDEPMSAHQPISTTTLLEAFMAGENSKDNEWEYIGPSTYGTPPAPKSRAERRAERKAQRKAQKQAQRKAKQKAAEEQYNAAPRDWFEKATGHSLEETLTKIDAGTTTEQERQDILKGLQPVLDAMDPETKARLDATEQSVLRQSIDRSLDKTDK